MKTYHNDKAVKAKYINRVKAHRLADELVQGATGHNGKGCAVWCALDEYNHARYPVELGLPEWLAFLEDHIFEALPEKEAQKWPEAFLKAVPVGVPDRQMDILRDQFQIFWLERQKTQIDQAKYPQVVAAIDGTIALLQQAIDDNEPERGAWSAAESAARSAAESAAEQEAIVKRNWLLENLRPLK